MSSNSLHDHVADYVAECVDYWTSAGLSGRRIELLKGEMEPSIQAAIDRGQSPEEALGTSLKWAKSQYELYSEEQSPREQRKFKLLGSLFCLLCTGALIVGIQHILHSTSSFPLGPGAVMWPFFVWAIVSLSTSIRVTSSTFNLVKRKGKFAYGDYLIAVSSFLTGILVPIQNLGETSLRLIEWHWYYSLTLIVAATVVGVMFIRHDPTRHGQSDPAIEESLGLFPNEKAQRRRSRKLNRIALACISWSALCFGISWLLTAPTARESTGIAMMVSLCCMLVLVCDELASERRNRSVVRA